jgi:hypothetical protein
MFYSIFGRILSIFYVQTNMKKNEEILFSVVNLVVVFPPIKKTDARRHLLMFNAPQGIHRDLMRLLKRDKENEYETRHNNDQPTNIVNCSVVHRAHLSNV